MARETKTFKVGVDTYEITHLKSKPARHALQIVTKAATPVLSAGSLSVDNEDEAIQAMLGRLGQVLDAIKPEDVDRLVELFSDETWVMTPESGGVKLKLSDVGEDHFAGTRFADQFPWLRECVSHNFAFLTTALSTLGAQKGQGAEPESQNTSTGSSTGSQAPSGTRAG